jgi:hypothetical protein
VPKELWTLLRRVVRRRRSYARRTAGDVGPVTVNGTQLTLGLASWGERPKSWTIATAVGEHFS